MSSKLIRTGILSIALLALPLSAMAAGLPRYKAPAYVSPSFFTWSGFYVGLNAGYGFGKSNWDIPVVSPSPKGALFGVTAGYNFQTGQWVWGLEGDLDWTGIKDDAACGAGTCETSNTWLGTARARLGYGGWTNWLPYITGGAAFGNIKANNSLVGSASDSRVGYALGAGVEYMLWNNLSVKAEYLYIDLGKFDCGISCGPLVTDDVSFKANLIRAGINYRF